MSSRILVLGGTGGIGRKVVEQSVAAGHHTRALVRDRMRGRRLLPYRAELISGRATDEAEIAAVLEGVDAVILTHGSHHEDDDAEAVDYGIVRNVVRAALAEQRIFRIVLMTSIGVTVHDGPYNLATQRHDWKRRSERLVRLSGLPYTIVRPGWFDYNASDEQKVAFRQGDSHRSGTPEDGAISRGHVAQVLLAAATSRDATGKTFELVATGGSELKDLDPLFSALQDDEADCADGALDPDTLPLAQEPESVIADLQEVTRGWTW